MKTRLSIFTLLAAILLSGCAKQKTNEELTFKELKTNTQVALKKKDYHEAAEFLETIIARFSDRPDIAKYKLALAQLYYKEERYPSSFELYSHYSKFYPGDINADVAKYRAIMAKFNQTLRDDCDQTTTTEALNLCNEYLQNNSNQKYAKQVKDVQHTCQKKLINKEIYVFNFYLKRGKYESANSRLAHLEKEFLPKDKSLEAQLLYLKCQLAQKTKKSDLLKENLSRLATDYPETRYAHMAQALTSAPKFIF